jgi:peptidoglycan-associated lipoprotein
MKKSLFTLTILVLLLAGVALTGTGCAKKPPLPPPVAKTEPPPPPPPPPAAPTVQLSASPTTIEKGQSTTLSWSSKNATNVSLDAGIGTVEASGTRTVSPGASTTYKVTASGAGGTATAETRITVTVPPPPPPPPPRTISDSEFFGSNVKDVYFDYDKYDIRSDAQTTLQGNSRALAERGGIKFSIEGHCDERGSEKYNLALGDKRANATKQYLVTQGVAADRIDTISYGEERQICTDHNESCWQQNRRAHFTIR